MSPIAKLAFAAPVLFALSACGGNEEPAAVETDTTMTTTEPMPMDTAAPMDGAMTGETPAPMDTASPMGESTDAMAPTTTDTATPAE